MNTCQRRWVIVGQFILTVTLLFGLVWPCSAAGVGGLFFSEYIEGSSNNQALEVYNATGGTVDLAAGKYSVEFYFDGAATPSRVIALTGKVEAGQVYVLANAAGAPSLRERADQLEGGAWFDGNDAVALRRGAARLDVIGQIGFDPGTAWRSGWDSTAECTLSRAEIYCQGDSNGGDVFSLAGDWRVSEVDTFAGLGTHTADCLQMPIPIWLFLWLGAAFFGGLVWWLERRRVNLGFITTFLKWSTGILLLMPVAMFVVERADSRTIVLAALGEMGLIGVVAGVLVGRKEEDKWMGALKWLPVILLSHLSVVGSLDSAGARLDSLAGYNKFAMVAISLIGYQAAFWITHQIRHARR